MRRLVRTFVLSLATALVSVLTLAGCGHRAAVPVVSIPSVGSPISIPGPATLVVDLRATPTQILAATQAVEPFTRHWVPLAYPGAKPLVVVAVEYGSLLDAGSRVLGCRLLGQGYCYVTYGATGSLAIVDQTVANGVSFNGIDWEIPLEEQDAQDPPYWSMGTWGPIYPGQSPAWKAASQ